jgi:hypothetical protein
MSIVLVVFFPNLATPGTMSIKPADLVAISCRVGETFAPFVSIKKWECQKINFFNSLF